jgi:hypothetical protein
MSGTGARTGFHGKRVLIVERELLVSFALYRAMERLGAEIVGPVVFPEDVSLLLAGCRLDGAILDSRTGADDRKAVLRALRHRHVPFVDACGCMSCVSGLDGWYRLSEAEEDLVVVARALFGGMPFGTLNTSRGRLGAENALSPARKRPRPSRWTEAAHLRLANPH